MDGEPEGCGRSVVVRLGRKESTAKRAENTEDTEKSGKGREAGGMARHEWESQLQLREPPEGLIFQGKNSVEPILRTENLWKLYRAGKVEVPALRGVNFAVQPGESVAVDGAFGLRQVFACCT